MKKVLMLGWEFPPLLSGGLGIATYGLVKALSRHTDIHLIVPSTDVHPDLNVQITGLNRLTSTQYDLVKDRMSSISDRVNVHSLPVTISPYHHVNQMLERSDDMEADMLQSKKSTQAFIRNLFSEREAYGINTKRKVYLYTKLAEEIASETDFDVIHAHDWVTFQAGINIRMRYKKPLVLHVHSLETDRAGHATRNELYALEKGAMETADKIIAVSLYTKMQIVEHYSIDASKIVVVHNGIEAKITARKEHKLREKIVVFLGRLTHQKGPHFLLETVEKVVRVYPRVKFVVAGTGDQFIHLLETSAYKRMGKYFLFTGFLSKEKVDELLSMADVYFMPSVSEPFGLTALEAAQYNVPAVISSQSGAAEVLTASLKADFWDTDKYANYIVALLRYDALSRTLSEKATDQLQGITWNHAAEKILRLYNELQ